MLQYILHLNCWRARIMYVIETKNIFNIKFDGLEMRDGM